MNSSQLDRVSIGPDKFGGRACIRGRRIRVSDILETLGNVAIRRLQAVFDRTFAEALAAGRAIVKIG